MNLTFMNNNNLFLLQDTCISIYTVNIIDQDIRLFVDCLINMKTKRKLILNLLIPNLMNKKKEKIRSCVSLKKKTTLLAHFNNKGHPFEVPVLCKHFYGLLSMHYLSVIGGTMGADRIR